METNMRAQAVVREERPSVAGWMSRKSRHAVMLLFALLGISLAVNASIIVLAGTGL
jgi:4-hydroxybenzoate polyprenyltransferase